MTVNEILQNGGLLSTVIDNYTQRNGQVEMTDMINKAYEQKKTILINAPTGNGKSFSSLIPAILNKDKGRTLISTATKSLQEQYQNKDIPILHKIFDFTSFTLKGRDNYLCNKKINDCDGFTSFSTDEFKKIKEWADNTQTGDFEELPFVLPYIVKKQIHSNSDDCLEEGCPYYDQCYYRKNKLKASQSDIVIINHDLLSLYLTLSEKGVKILGNNIYSIIIDEAHKFEDVITKYLGIRVNINSCNKIIDMSNVFLETIIKKYYQNAKEKNINVAIVTGYIISIKFYMNKFFENFDDIENTCRLYEKNINSDVCIWLCKDIIKLKEYFYELSTKISLNSSMNKQLEKFINKCDNLVAKFDVISNIKTNISDYVYYIDSSGRYNVLNIVPIDVSSFTRKLLFNRYKNAFNKIGCVCLLSATLAIDGNFDFIKKRLGINSVYIDESDTCLLELLVPDTFDYKHQCLLYIPKGIVAPANKQKDRKVFTQQLIKNIKELSKFVDGGILSLFTSYYELDEVYNSLMEDKIEDSNNSEIKYRTLLNQKLLPRKKIINSFKDDTSSILMATSSFWEGIDVQGDACSCVIIDRIPFPVPSEPVIEARIDKIKENHGDWFNEYYLPMAIISLQQGFGRLIRTHTDCGIVVIMDNRILNKPYGRKIIRSLPNCLQTRDIKKVKVFFDIVKMKRKIYKNKRG